MKKITNEGIKKVINHYQYGNILFLEAVQAIINMKDNGKATKEEAEAAIKYISKIKLPY